MDAEFQSISSFRDSIDTLCKKRTHGYFTCKKDICEALKGNSFEDIWERKFLLRQIGSDHRLIKVRVANSYHRKGTPAGFRVIVLCNKKDKTVTFLDIYPKTGFYAKADQDTATTTSQVILTQSESFVKHNILDDLSVIKTE